MTDDQFSYPPPYPYPPQSQPEPPRKSRRLAVGLGLVGAGVAAGAIIGGTVLSNAATTTPTAPTTASSSSSSTTAPGSSEAGEKHDHGSGSGRSDEKAVTGALLTKLKAEALKAVPGGTVDRVETDAGDGVYEAHMTKADGSEVTVKFDKSGVVTKVESGMGSGDPHDH